MRDNSASGTSCMSAGTPTSTSMPSSPQHNSEHSTKTVNTDSEPEQHKEHQHAQLGPAQPPTHCWRHSTKSPQTNASQGQSAAILNWAAGRMQATRSLTRFRRTTGATPRPRRPTPPRGNPPPSTTGQQADCRPHAAALARTQHSSTAQPPTTNKTTSADDKTGQATASPAQNRHSSHHSSRRQTRQQTTNRTGPQQAHE